MPDVAWQFGPYRVDELIARGGMGEVHRAYDTRHDRFVALKLLTDRAADDDEFRKRFKREAHAAARLREPHVIPIHAYGEIDGRLYLDMRLVEGHNLSKTLALNGPMSPETAVDVIGQVAAALDAAHSEGLIHRDVKPSNVILQGDFAYLVDFGIARPLTANTDITGTGEALGTLSYMAPERFGSGPVDHRVDIYALACVLFQCLTGDKPFTAENPLAVIFAHANDDPPSPSERREGVPTGLDRVVAKGMAKDPGERYASAGELAAAARKALVSDSTKRLPPVPPPVPVETPADAPVEVPPKRRGPQWKIVAAMVAVVVIAGLAIWWWPKTYIIEPTPTTPIPTPRELAAPTNPPCDGTFIVIVGSAVTPANYTSDLRQFLAENVGAKYLHAPTTGCSSLRTHIDGTEIYSVYYGPFPDKNTACAKRNSVGRDSFVRRLDNSSPNDRAVSCR
ncbi:serine/threonine-protein kinase [Kibdelosporangium philippinense]|uniref:serine/threonine-protein kinase n=1 Tax=Kibdelosporangium philippinense TaxID=211113 RepID=UPI0024C2FB0A